MEQARARPRPRGGKGTAETITVGDETKQQDGGGGRRAKAAAPAVLMGENIRQSAVGAMTSASPSRTILPA